MEEEKNKTETEEQKYKLLSAGERKYILMSEEEINRTYKRADLTKAQYDSRIRRRVFGALDDIKFISEKYSEKKLGRIFTADRIDDIIKILEKASIVATSIIEKTLSDPKKFVLYSSKYEERKKHFLEQLQNIETYFMTSDEIKSREELIEEYGKYLNVRSIIYQLEGDLRNCHGERERLLAYLQEKGLITEYKQWEEDTIRDSIKKLGLSENIISEVLKKKKETGETKQL